MTGQLDGAWCFDSSLHKDLGEAPAELGHSSAAGTQHISWSAQ